MTRPTLAADLPLRERGRQLRRLGWLFFVPGVAGVVGLYALYSDEVQGVWPSSDYPISLALLIVCGVAFAVGGVLTPRRTSYRRPVQPLPDEFRDPVASDAAAHYGLDVAPTWAVLDRVGFEQVAVHRDGQQILVQAGFPASTEPLLIYVDGQNTDLRGDPLPSHLTDR